MLLILAICLARHLLKTLSLPRFSIEELLLNFKQRDAAKISICSWNNRVMIFFLRLFFFSQATGIVFILLCQLLEVPRRFKDHKCHGKAKDDKVPDFERAMYFMTSAAAAMAILLICTFKPSYKRLEMERRRAAIRILNAGNQRRLPTFPSNGSISENGGDVPGSP